MHLKLKNILKIEKADIEFKGLTVIAGENSTGKSSIGKILFSLIKSANIVKEADRIRIIQIVKTYLKSIRELSEPYYYFDILNNIQLCADKIISSEEEFEKFKNIISSQIVAHIPDVRKITLISNRLEQISNQIYRLTHEEDSSREDFKTIIASEFGEKIPSFSSTESEIKFYDDSSDKNIPAIDIQFSHREYDNLKFKNNLSAEDVTFIESPVYLPILNVLRTSGSVRTEYMKQLNRLFYRYEEVPFHLADMADKILRDTFEEENFFSESKNFREILDSIQHIIGGSFKVQSKTNKLFLQEGKVLVPSVSVASGIKSFGILQRLIQTDNISPFKIIIWDEPEIHLHPDWQVKFCEIIIDMVKKGVPVVISSHSPYFIQGLRYYAAAKGVEDLAKYYWGHINEKTGLALFEDVSGNLNTIFSQLALPLQKIMNVDTVRHSR